MILYFNPMETKPNWYGSSHDFILHRASEVWMKHFLPKPPTLLASLKKISAPLSLAHHIIIPYCMTHGDVQCGRLDYNDTMMFSQTCFHFRTSVGLMQQTICKIACNILATRCQLLQILHQRLNIVHKKAILFPVLGTFSKLIIRCILFPANFFSHAFNMF